jgi:hypothetical protein
MNKVMLGALFGLALAASSASAQIILTRPGSAFGGPFGGPTVDPRSGYQYGQPGYGYGYPGVLGGYGAGLPGTIAVPGVNGFGTNGLAGRGNVVVQPASPLAQEQLTANVTGHPTRFDNYRRYFDNQGGSLQVQTAGLGILPNTGLDGLTNPGFLGQGTTQTPGTPPVRGKTNSQPRR